MPVQQHVLNWLYSVLTSEYHDVNRTYNDVAQTLARYPSLSPRTDVHTFANGSSALLVNLHGTIPVNFRGNTYRFPMSIWVPHAYPREAPVVYVKPTETMMVRPGQHVDPQGQVYHPYLVGWVEFWDKSTIHDFLAILSDIFAKEPPVVARQQQQQPQQPSASSTPAPLPMQSPPPRPPLPSEMSAHSRSDSRGDLRPPPPPPKPHQEARSSTAGRYDTGPPLPPLPSQATGDSATRRTSRYDSAPPLPSQAQHSRSPPAQGRPGSQHYQQADSYQGGQGPPRGHHMSPPPFQHMQSGPPPGNQLPHPNSIRHPREEATSTYDSPISQRPGYHGGPPPHGPHGHAQYQNPHGPSQMHARQMQPQAAAPPQPPPDLLDEELPLTLHSESNVTAPPIPPNPEKDALLAQLASTLHQMRQKAYQQNSSSLAGLSAQRQALQAAVPIIHQEMSQLQQLSSLITSNQNILHEAMHKADGVIEGSKRHEKVDVDQLLVAPTVVANQLYQLVAEERALGDAIFVLGRAVEKGRISVGVFVKLMRSLSREWYLKKALVLEIGKGMGLAQSAQA